MSDFSRLENSLRISLERYKSKVTNDQSADSFVNYLATNGRNVSDDHTDVKLTALFDYWDSLDGDGISKTEARKDNSISEEHFFAKDDNLLFEINGEMVKFDIKSGNLEKLDDSTAADLINEYLSESGETENNVTAEMIRDHKVLLNNDSVKITTQYSFGAGSAADPVPNNDIVFGEEKIDLTKEGSLDKIKSIIQDFESRNIDMTSLKDIFGDQANALYNTNSNGKMAMAIVQDGRAFVVKYDPNTSSIVTDELDNADVLTEEQVNSGCTVQNFRIENGKLTYTLLNPTGSTSSGTTNAWGDPHFKYNGATAFDFQGMKAGTYQMLNSSDISLTADFKEWQGGMQGSRVIGKQTLDFKGTGITLVASGDKTFKILLNGEEIGNQSNYSDPRIAQAGINLTFNGTSLVTTYNDRTITQNLYGSYMENNVTTKAGDAGLLTQAQGAATGQFDENQYLVYSAVSADAAPVLTISGVSAETLAADFMNLMERGYSAYAPFTGAFSGSCNTINSNDSETVKAAKLAQKAILAFQSNKTPENKQAAMDATAKWIKLSSEAMLNDLNNGTGSIASRFREGQGYSRSQWNEFLGTVAYTKGADANNDGVFDAGLDLDSDGFADGFDLNHDGQISSDEKFLYNVGDYHKEEGTVSEWDA